MALPKRVLKWHTANQKGSKSWRDSSPTKEMSHSTLAPRVRKRSRPEEPAGPGREEVKFEDVRLYLVERKMGRSRRSFLTQLARSKGFIVEDALRLGKSLPFCFSKTQCKRNCVFFGFHLASIVRR